MSISDKRPCEQSEISQVSTGQAGPEINRDFETVFRAVNRLIRCTGKISAFLDSNNNGSFGGGSGEGGGGGGGVQPPVEGPLGDGDGRRFWLYSADSDFTMPEGFGGIAYVDPSADIVVTLNSSVYGRGVVIAHTGTANTMTVRDAGGVTIGTIKPGQWAPFEATFNASGTPSWGPGSVVLGSDGKVYLMESLVFRSSSAGPMLKSPGGNWWLLSVNNAGVLSTSDQGTTEPVVTPP